MSSVEDVIYAALLADAGVAALASTRIYLIHAPQGAACPRLLYQLVSTQPRPQGMGRDVPIERVRFQFTAQADTPTGARDLAEAVKTAFEQFTAAGPPQVDHAQFMMATDIPGGARPTGDAASRIYGRAVDILFAYRRD